MKKHLISILIIFIMISSPFVIVSNSSTSIEQKYLEVIQPIIPKEVSQNHVWPMQKHDAQRTGRSIYDTSQNKGGEKWKYFIDSSLWGAVVMDNSSIIYIGTTYDGLHAVYPNGTIKWKNDLEGREYQTPAIAPDGTIYIGTTEQVYAFNPDGTLKWIFNITGNFFCEPIVDSNGTVYIATQDGEVYAIYSNGTIKWQYEVLDYIFDIALDKDENIYFCGSYNNLLTCLNPDGTVKWTYEQVNMWYGPVIGDDGTIYIVPIHDLVALNPNGTVKWIVDFNFTWNGCPSIAPDGTIIISGHSEFVTALDPVDGSIIWQYKIGEWPLIDPVSTAAIGGDGTIYFAYTAYSNSESYLSALTPDGKLKWETHLTTDILPYDSSEVLSEPSIGNDGIVYITSWFMREGSNYTSIGYIHAIGMDNPIAPDSPTIIGPQKVKLLQEYEYTLCCNISTGGDVYYFIDWDDKEEGHSYDNNWIGPYPSGMEVTVNHTFMLLKKHTIKVKAKGIDSLCSPWSTFEVSKSNNNELFNGHPILSWIFERFPNAFPILRHVLTY